MGRAASGRLGNDVGILEELEFHWGSAYHLAVIDSMCTARRRDEKGVTLADALPEGLRLQIVADYERTPMTSSRSSARSSARATSSPPRSPTGPMTARPRTCSRRSATR